MLKGLSFDLCEGKITTLIGANGCGKSTLFHLMTKNLKPDGGVIEVHGKNLSDIRLKDFAKQAAIVHQYNTAPADLSVEKLISYGRMPYHTLGLSHDAKEDEEKVRWAMEITHTVKHKDKPEQRVRKVPQPEINGKTRLLYLLRLLYRKTDEQHPITTAEICMYFKEQGVPLDRKTVKTDVDILIALGYDIVVIHSTQNRYFAATRMFELPELKLLIDAVESSKFITKKKSVELAGKLSSLASEYQATELKRGLYIADRVKPENEQIYYFVDYIHTAVNSEKQISFRYLIAYYLAHKPKDSDWVVLPVVSFDAYFGGTTFSKKILSQLPKDIIIRDRTGYGVSRYKVAEDIIFDGLKKR